MNLCRSCGLDFASAFGFDKHRVGTHAFTHAEGLHFNPPSDDGRRCLARTELKQAGWNTNPWSRWVPPRNTPSKGAYADSQPLRERGGTSERGQRR